jgi:hypothetical protein
MNEKEDTISKIETVEEAAKKRFPIYEGYITEIDRYLIYSRRNAFELGARWQKAQPEFLNFENVNFKAFVKHTSEKLQHCYTEQELLIILETFRSRIINSARVECWDFDNYKVDKDSISDVDYTDLLKTPTS